MGGSSLPPNIAGIVGLQAALDSKRAATDGAFTVAVSLNNGVLTASAPAFTLGQTWNNAAVPFHADDTDITNTASASGSTLKRWRVGGVDKFAINKDGYPVLQGLQLLSNPDGNTLALWPGNAYGSAVYVRPNLGSGAMALWLANGIAFGDNTPASQDTGVGRNAAGVTEFNNGTLGTLRDWKSRRGTITEYLDMAVSGEPAAPASGARLWVDQVAGKALLMCRFATGASQIVSQEP